MQYRALVVFLIIGKAALQADPSPEYYALAEGKTGAELRETLHIIIRNHRVLPYTSSTRTDTREALRTLDEDPANTNNVILIYARRSEPKSTFGQTTGWNREHLWPNSYGIDGREPAYSDLHNLRAADATVNSARGNKFFDFSDPDDPNYRDPAHVEAPLCTADTDSWEPPEEVKGDIARAMFYMTIRYMGTATNEPDLTLTDETSLISSANSMAGRLRTLLKWHAADPVDDRERLRNDLIDLLYQTNRNPFVDRPEWVNRAFVPALRIIHAGTNLWLEWPEDFTDVVLESSAGLPENWSTVTDTVVFTTNSVFRAVLPLPDSPRFYRLRL